MASGTQQSSLIPLNPKNKYIKNKLYSIYQTGLRKEIEYGTAVFNKTTGLLLSVGQTLP